MNRLDSVCVYCGSSNDVSQAYKDLATALGRALAARSWRLVYGGGGVGLMGATARATHEAGGEVLGIIPRFLLAKERLYDAVPHEIVDTMHERKTRMFDEADAFIVLPGGIGTLEEAVEVLSWARLGLHSKPTIFLHEDGYWDPFFELIEHTIIGGFNPASFRDLLGSAKTPEEALDLIAHKAISIA
jgi:uncharacterized protein (TIGR00730 family)